MLESQETIDREFHAYDSITDNYPKNVISYDDMQMQDKDGIIHVRLLDFLLDEHAIMNA